MSDAQASSEAAGAGGDSTRGGGLDGGASEAVGAGAVTSCFGAALGVEQPPQIATTNITSARRITGSYDEMARGGERGSTCKPALRSFERAARGRRPASALAIARLGFVAIGDRSLTHATAAAVAAAVDEAAAGPGIARGLLRLRGCDALGPAAPEGRLCEPPLAGLGGRPAAVTTGSLGLLLERALGGLHARGAGQRLAPPIGGRRAG